MSARDVMTRFPATALPNDTVTVAARLMRDRGVGLLPVVENVSTLRLIGVITDRDIAVRCVAEGHDGKCTVSDHMTRPPLHTVTPGEGVDAVVKTMERSRIRRVLVVESGDRLVGVIAQADLATKIGPNDARLVEEMLETISRP